MRIESLHMEGFGHFHDTGIETLPPGAVIVAGPNEAGKSTALGSSSLSCLASRRNARAPTRPSTAAVTGAGSYCKCPMAHRSRSNESKIARTAFKSSAPTVRQSPRSRRRSCFPG
ncbi:MAG: AAA family ATPase [Blastocatellia bacterium]|nr:AAA family ATPase [Blastocatellia bacterium]